MGSSYEKFTPVINRDDLTTAEYQMIQELVALSDSPSGQFIRKVLGSFVNEAVPAALTYAKKTFTTTGGSQVIPLGNVPAFIVDVVVYGQVQSPADYAIMGSDVNIAVADIPAGLWGYINYLY